MNHGGDTPCLFGQLGDSGHRAPGGDVDFSGQHPMTVAAQCLRGGLQTSLVDVSQHDHPACSDPSGHR